MFRVTVVTVSDVFYTCVFLLMRAVRLYTVHASVLVVSVSQRLSVSVSQLSQYLSLFLQSTYKENDTQRRTREEELTILLLIIIYIDIYIILIYNIYIYIYKRGDKAFFLGGTK